MRSSRIGRMADENAMKYVKMNCGVNRCYKLPVDAGFLSDNAATTTAVLREKIK
jgi:hypothetical protein